MASPPECLERYSTLEQLCQEHIQHFSKDETSAGRRLLESLHKLAENVKVAKELVSSIQSFAHEYDFDSSVPGNGYRSFANVTNACVDLTLEVLTKLAKSRRLLVFRKSWYAREIDAHETLLASICSCLKYLIILREWSEPGDLFPTGIHTANELFERGEPVNQLSFYGRCLGFQFCKSMRRVLVFISTCMAGFSESYFSQSNFVLKTVASILHGGKYFVCPEARAKRIVNIVQNADVGFCKAFWFLAEGEIMQRYPAVVGASLEVNRVIQIPPEPLTVDHLVTGQPVDITIPKSHFGPMAVTARLLSKKRRKGMIGEFGSSGKILPPSEALIIHSHGGGFVAQSSKSHEIYVRDWAVELDVPILSIDYSLAPQAPYPRALEEVFYTYCWVLKNCHLLGSTGKRIILVGDSAGSNLNLGATLKCIQLGIRKPDGLFIAYCPFLVSFVPSPARILCLMDPLLPFGFMMRCLKSYVSPSVSINAENSKRSQMLEKIANAGRDTKVYSLEPLKAKLEDRNRTEMEKNGLQNSSCLDQISLKENNIHSIRETSPTTSNSKEFLNKFVDKYVDSQSPDNKLVLQPTLHKTSSEDNLLLDVGKHMLVSRKTEKTCAAEDEGSTESASTEIKNICADSESDTVLLKNPTDEFDFDVPKDPLMSPYLASDEDLKRLPSVKVLSVEMDPCLDDCVMFAKKLKRLEVPVSLDVIKGLPHGFLNLVKVSKEADDGSKLCVKRIKELMEL